MRRCTLWNGSQVDLVSGISQLMFGAAVATLLGSKLLHRHDCEKLRAAYQACLSWQLLRYRMPSSPAFAQRAGSCSQPSAGCAQQHYASCCTAATWPCTGQLVLQIRCRAEASSCKLCCSQVPVAHAGYSAIEGWLLLLWLNKIA